MYLSGMSTDTALGPEWEVEAADPEVGFLSDTVTHLCLENLFAAKAADQTDVTHTTDGGEVVEVTTFTCPVCNGTTEFAQRYPLWHFEDERGDDDEAYC